jgi:hypothetical protein
VSSAPNALENRGHPKGGRRLLRVHVSQQVIDDSGLVAALYEWFENYDPPPAQRVVSAN